MSARIFRNGPMTRFMGRFCSEPSPVSFDEILPRKFPPAAAWSSGIPGIERAATALQAAQSAAVTRTVSCRFDFRASALMHANVLGQSAGRGKMAQFAGAFGQAGEHRYRWETDCRRQVQPAGNASRLNGFFFSRKD